MSFIAVSEPPPTAVPQAPGIWFTLVGVWSYGQTKSQWQFVSWDNTSQGYAPDGYIYSAVGDTPSAYILAVSRSDPHMGMAAVPVPGTLSQFWLVDVPTPAGSAPAPSGKALVGRWIQSIASQTGWAFQSWATADWDIYPDGHNLTSVAGGSATLELVMARTTPDEVFVGIPYNPIQGALPPPPAPPGSAGPPGEQDEVAECCAQITAALQALTTAVQAIAGIVASQGGGNQPPPPPIDLSGIIRELEALTKQTAEIAKCVCEIADHTTKVIDLSPLVEAIAALGSELVNALDRTPAAYEPQTEALRAAIQNIADTDANLTPEVKRIADSMKDTYPAQDVASHDVIQWLNAHGLIDPALAQETDV